uniref:Uncharacterized protein n=1 Tax=Oryza rufipogon TaxID=4529 RepID=A0A0E0QB72_ORYRU
MPREPVVTSAMREEATTSLARSSWRRRRLPTAAVTVATAVAASTSAVGWRGNGRGGRGVVRPRGWRGLLCRRRGGRRRVVVVEASVVRQREGVMEAGGGVESRPATSGCDGGRLVALAVATVDVAAVEEVRMATARWLGIRQQRLRWW